MQLHRKLIQHIMGYVPWLRSDARGIFLPLRVGGALPRVGPMFGEEHLLAAAFATSSPATETLEPLKLACDALVRVLQCEHE